MVELGLSLGTSHKEPIARSLDLIEAAEAEGLDHVWCLDAQLTMKDTYVVQSLAAERTSSIRLGPGVTNLETRDPTVTANAISDVREVSEGRARLGIGTGDSAIKPLGMSPTPLSELRTGIEQIRGLLQGESVEYDGETVGFKDIQGPVPIYVAASGPTSLRFAGEFGDGVVMMTPADPEMVEWGLQRIERGVADRDHGLAAEPSVDLWLTISMDEDPEAAARDVKPQALAQSRWLKDADHLSPALERHRDEMEAAVREYQYEDHLSLTGEHADLISDELARSIAIAGTPEDCLERLREIAALGVDSITLTLLTKGRERRLRALGEQIVPELVDSGS